MRIFGLYITTAKRFDEIIAIWSDRVAKLDARLARAGRRVNGLREKLWVAHRGGYTRARPEDIHLDEMQVLGYDERLSYQPGCRVDLEARITIQEPGQIRQRLATESGARVAFRGLSWIATNMGAEQRGQEINWTLTLVAYADPHVPGPYASPEQF